MDIAIRVFVNSWRHMRTKALAVLVVLVLVLPRLVIEFRHNIRSLSMSRSIVNPELIVSNSTSVAHDQERLWGALQLYRAQYAASLPVLNEYVRQPHPDNHVAWFQIAQANYKLGNLVEAGKAYEASGAFGIVDRFKTFPELTSRLGGDQVDELSDVALAMAHEADRTHRIEDALRYAHLATRLTRTPDELAEALYVSGKAELARGNYLAALTTFRQSLDIAPSDAGRGLSCAALCEAAAQLVEANDCLPSASLGPTLSLLPLYSDRARDISETCAAKLTEAAYTRLPFAFHPYIALRHARRANERALPDQAREWLQRAETQGLSRVWQMILMPDTATTTTTASIVPRYTVEDARLLGFELDPIEVELGLPLDIILFYRKGVLPKDEVQLSTETADLVLYRAVNLASDPGFEYAAIRDCAASLCLDDAYEVDPYGAPVDARRIVVRDRPLEAQAENVATAVLALDNRNNPLKKAGWTSSSREVTPGARYLQAGWIQSSQGNGYLGRAWEGTDRSQPFDYAVAELRDSEWKYVWQVVEPPRDATSFKLAALNFESNGEAAFDSMLFIALPH